MDISFYPKRKTIIAANVYEENGFRLYSSKFEDGKCHIWITIEGIKFNTELKQDLALAERQFMLSAERRNDSSVEAILKRANKVKLGIIAQPPKHGKLIIADITTEKYKGWDYQYSIFYYYVLEILTEDSYFLYQTSAEMKKAVMNFLLGYEGYKKSCAISITKSGL